MIKNISVVTTSQIEVALSLLQTNLPDCIVIDTAMKSNIGFQFIHEIKKDGQFKYIPFILLTTKGLTEDRIRGYDLGCSAYILN
uniref:TctD-like protein n=1 Tax=Cryptomonas curvata TaxID=233186 RepID=A0A222AH58_9CRYP|nr:TctD-like protein [Cryptomonas curvata]ASO75711.1 TctD-like protein [Cryptomonas curvata]